MPLLHVALSSAVALVLQVALLGTVLPASQAHDGDHSADPATVLKPALRGLVVTQPRSLATVPYADFASLRLPWNSIETAPGVFNFSSIDGVLAAHDDVQFRLRIMAGIHSPQWVKDVSGGCVLIEPNSPNGNTGCAPRFWTDAFHGHYVNLMEAVAARYEDNPQVVEIANSECTTIYSEPFILGADTASIDRLWAANYTKAGHETCLRRSTSAMMDLFDTTRISIAGHTRWQYIVQAPGTRTTASTRRRGRTSAPSSTS
ncbi:beta-galactosidase [Nocardioides immobilis]|uniref:beta-galactosidase n=1 Tax=Nocardioides immobilis TaxID=2049295 RepID=UPI0015FE08BA|nr:beta-galactosidase [Nocardioides immobilis]